MIFRRCGAAHWGRQQTSRRAKYGVGTEPVLLKCLFSEENLARETGLEPATSGVTGRRSNQLSYSRKTVNDPQEVGLKGGDIPSQGAPSLFLFVRNFGNRPASCRNTAYP